MTLLHHFRNPSLQFHPQQISSRFLHCTNSLPLTPSFQSLLETGGGGLTPGGAVFGGVERASNGSPAGSWGRSASPRRAPSSSNNMWAGEGWDHAPSQVPQSTPGLGGWDHAPSLAQGAQLVPQHTTHSTNPFGTSPSNPTYHAPGDRCVYIQFIF